MNKAPSVVSLARADVADARDVLRLIADQAALSPLLVGHKADEILALLDQREQVISTAVGNGIAIPHCFVSGIEDFVIGVLTVPDGIDFAAPDGEPVTVFFFIIGPPDQRNRHVSILSEISRAMHAEANRHALIAAPSNDALAQAASSLISLHVDQQDTICCEVKILVQHADLFDPILEALSAHVDGNIAVQELRPARTYLHRIPLFATLWSSDVDEDVRLIIAIMDKQLVNDMARRIRQVCEEEGHTGGVLITAHELLYRSGGIDF